MRAASRLIAVSRPSLKKEDDMAKLTPQDIDQIRSEHQMWERNVTQAKAQIAAKKAEVYSQPAEEAHPVAKTAGCGTALLMVGLAIAARVLA